MSGWGRGGQDPLLRTPDPPGVSKMAIKRCLPALRGEMQGMASGPRGSICELARCPLRSRSSRPWWTLPRTRTPSRTCKLDESGWAGERNGQILDMQEDSRRRVERREEWRVAWKRVVRILNLSSQISSSHSQWQWGEISQLFRCSSQARSRPGWVNVDKDHYDWGWSWH